MLSSAYDLLPVNVVNPEDKDQMALTINGKKELYISECKNSYLTDELKKRLIELIMQRCDNLYG